MILSVQAIIFFSWMCNILYMGGCFVFIKAFLLPQLFLPWCAPIQLEGSSNRTSKTFTQGNKTEIGEGTWGPQAASWIFILRWPETGQLNWKLLGYSALQYHYNMCERNVEWIELLHTLLPLGLGLPPGETWEPFITGFEPKGFISASKTKNVLG